ncbi:MAG: DUF447 family protein [Methanosarcinales archaeon]|nr:DUF447 family protein [Methanosarcinales archaeon]
MKKDPKKYGIREGINEVIVTTRSLDGKPNAAPVGIINDKEIFKVKVFSGSHTSTNVTDTGLLAANIIGDPILFVRCALGDLDTEMFTMIRTDTGIAFPVLAQSSAWVLFKADYTSGSTAITAQLSMIAGNIINQELKSVNRGFNAVIEALVIASRYKVFKDETYLDRIKSYGNLVNKCGGTSEKEAYDMIIEYMRYK